MKKFFVFLAAAYTLTGCQIEAKTTEYVGDTIVSQLFTYDGCVVYRFVDQGRAHYFAKCENVCNERVIQYMDER